MSMSARCGATTLATGRRLSSNRRSLALLAAHAEHPEFPQPSAVVERLDRDHAWTASSGKGYFENSRYQQLLGAELWLPCDFNNLIWSELEGDDPVGIGSSYRL